MIYLHEIPIWSLSLRIASLPTNNEINLKSEATLYSNVVSGWTLCIWLFGQEPETIFVHKAKSMAASQALKFMNTPGRTLCQMINGFLPPSAYIFVFSKLFSSPPLLLESFMLMEVMGTSYLHPILGSMSYKIHAPVTLSPAKKVRIRIKFLAYSSSSWISSKDILN